MSSNSNIYIHEADQSAKSGWGADSRATGLSVNLDCHLLAVWPQASDLTSLCVSVLYL